jgi:hypothetical protein
MKMIPVVITGMKKEEKIIVDSDPMSADGITIVTISESTESVKENASGKGTETAMTKIVGMRGTY